MSGIKRINFCIDVSWRKKDPIITEPENAISMNLQRTGQRSIKTFDFGHEIWGSDFPFSGKDKSLLRNILTIKELSLLACSFFCNKINIANSIEKCFFASVLICTNLNF